MNYRDRIHIEPGKRGGKPCIRSMRMTVYGVLDYLLIRHELNLTAVRADLIEA